jgi:hypothetical protein
MYQSHSYMRPTEVYYDFNAFFRVCKEKRDISTIHQQER